MKRCKENTKILEDVPVRIKKTNMKNTKIRKKAIKARTQNKQV